MTLDSSIDRNRLRHEAKKIGITLTDDAGHLPSTKSFGHELPELFLWFCQRYKSHSGFPHHGWEPPYGLLSPWGLESELERRNVGVRRNNPTWPLNWIIFWHGNDGDYCFSFDRDGHPWIVYWHYNFLYHEENRHLEFRDIYVAADFAEWFSQQADWVLEHQLDNPVKTVRD